MVLYNFNMSWFQLLNWATVPYGLILLTVGISKQHSYYNILNFIHPSLHLPPPKKKKKKKNPEKNTINKQKTSNPKKILQNKQQ